MGLIPIYDKIIAVKVNEDQKYGNIVIPTSENSIIKAKIIEVGFGKLINGKNSPLYLKKNDIIIFKNNFNVEKYKHENIIYYILKEEDVLATIN